MTEDKLIDEALAKLDSFVETTVSIKDPDKHDIRGFNPEGMHPGVVNGKRVAPKENTSKPYKSGKGKLAQHQKRLSDRRNAHSYTIGHLPGNVPATSFRTPGSMKQHNGG
jgi:hypothetical protein